MVSNLEDRLIVFASMAMSVCENLNYSEASKHLKSQLLRSATSVALNFGEARSSESTKDLHHKYRIILKESRETYINLKLIEQNSLCRDPRILDNALEENNQLIAIFVKSLQTIRGKMNKS